MPKTKKFKIFVICSVALISSGALFAMNYEISILPPTINAPHISIRMQRRQKVADNRQSTTPAPQRTTSNYGSNTERETSKQTITQDGQTFKNRRYYALAVPNDQYAGQSWEDDIQLAAARDIGVGDYTPTIAVIDSGVALGHEDLAGLWLENAGESGATDSEQPSRLNCTDQSLALDKSCNLLDDDLNGTVDDESGTTTRENASQLNCTDQSLALDKSCNLIDDDGNGLVDDYIGYDFSNSDRSVAPGETDPLGEGVSHATFVAGAAAATNNNTVGIAGISSNARILPIQALEDEGSGYSSTVADAIYYAADRGVDIINLSLGSLGTDPYTELAIRYASQRGIAIIAASGNDGCECVYYPAADSQVLAVGAADGSNYASFSNYGVDLDVIAPGTDIITTSWNPDNSTNAYSYVSGTSIATPIVSGLAANLISHNSDLSPLQLRGLITEKAASLSQAKTPHDSKSGYGIVSALHSMSRLTTAYSPAQIYKFSPVRHGQALSGLWSATDIDTPLTVYDCSPHGTPTTIIYRLRKSTTYLYTASPAEAQEAQNNGYSVLSQFSSCMLFDHDSPKTVRTINLYNELDNQPTQLKFNP